MIASRLIDIRSRKFDAKITLIKHQVKYLTIELPKSDEP